MDLDACLLQPVALGQYFLHSRSTRMLRTAHRFGCRLK